MEKIPTNEYDHEQLDKDAIEVEFRKVDSNGEKGEWIKKTEELKPVTEEEKELEKLNSLEAKTFRLSIFVNRELNKEPVEIIDAPVGISEDETRELVLENESVKKLIGDKYVKAFHFKKKEVGGEANVWFQVD